MIYLSSDLVLTDGFDIDGNNPVIGWRNKATIDNIDATSENDEHPVTDIVNPATFLKWRALNTSQQIITVNLGDEVFLFDYVAFMGHNLGSNGLQARVEGFVGGVWINLTSTVLFVSDEPVMFRFTPILLSQIRLKIITGALAIPEISVMHAGKLLIMQRRVYVGHTPINFGRVSDTTNGKSESGQYLGRITKSRWLETSIAFANLSPQWYRENMDPFIAVCHENPFFLAWRPEGYPYEVGYVYTTTDPRPVNQRPNGMMSISLDLSGVAS